MEPKASILVVDDEEEICLFIKETVQLAGYSADTSLNAESAFDACRNKDYDIVLIDMVLPDLSGIKLLKKIKKYKPKTIVIIFTGYASIGSAVEALKLGAYNYITKPLDMKKLIKLIEKSLYLQTRISEERALIPLQKDVVELTIPNDLSYTKSIVNLVMKNAISMGFQEDQLEIGIPYAIDESIANAVMHGNRNDKNKKIYIRCEFTNDKIEIHIRDEGEGFDITNLPNPLDEKEFTSTTGRGLFLIKCYMDKISFNEKANEIRMIKYKGKNLCWKIHECTEKMQKECEAYLMEACHRCWEFPNRLCKDDVLKCDDCDLYMTEDK